MEMTPSAEEQAMVAELMAPSERLVGDPPLYKAMGSGILVEVILSPREPVDDPDDE